MSAHFPRATAHHTPGAVAGGLLAALLLLGAGARAQDGKAALAAVRGDLEGLLEDRDPVLRGEAALALATTGDVDYYDEVLAVASDRVPAARLRGIVALGYLAAPGAESFLGDLLLETGRSDADRAAAALALGLLPDGHSAPAVDAYLQRVDGGSYRRHRDGLASLLAALAQDPHPSRAGILVRLLDDDANKDPDLHRLALRGLAPVPQELSRLDLERWLTSARAGDRLGVLEALAQAGARLAGPVLDRVETIATRDREPRVRAAALRLLTGQRQLCSLEIGVRALRSDHPDEVAAGVSAARHLGGGAIRSAMEHHILHARRPELQAAMLREYDVSSSAAFLDGCLRLASDRRNTEDVRVHAAALAARSGERKSRAALRRLFAEVEDPANLRTLVRAMADLDPALIALERVYPPTTTTDLRLLPPRLAALLATGHAASGALLQAALRSESLSSATKAELVRALRDALVRPFAPDVVAVLPKKLREVVE